MPLMRAPDGETAEVPWPEVRHYMAAGAQLMSAENQAPMGGAAYSGTPDAPGEMGPGLMDPMNFVPAARTGQAGVAVVRPAASAIGSAVSRAASTPAGKAAIKFGLRRIPGVDLMIDAADLAKGVATKKASEVGSAASRVGKEVVEEVAEELPKGMQRVGSYIRKIGKRAAKPKGKVAGEIKPAPKGSAASRVSPQKVVKDPESMKQVENGLQWIKRNVADKVQPAAAKRWINENVPPGLRDQALNEAKRLIGGL